MSNKQPPPAAPPALNGSNVGELARNKGRDFKVWSDHFICRVRARLPEDAALRAVAAFLNSAGAAVAVSVKDLARGKVHKVIITVQRVIVPNTTTGVNVADPKGKPVTLAFAPEPEQNPDRAIGLQELS